MKIKKLAILCSFFGTCSLATANEVVLPDGWSATANALHTGVVNIHDANGNMFKYIVDEDTTFTSTGGAPAVDVIANNNITSDMYDEVLGHNQNVADMNGDLQGTVDSMNLAMAGAEMPEWGHPEAGGGLLPDFTNPSEGNPSEGEGSGINPDGSGELEPGFEQDHGIHNPGSGTGGEVPDFTNPSEGN
ncbi:hypothetical protein L2725_05270, partial [Shewanella corallii]